MEIRIGGIPYSWGFGGEDQHGQGFEIKVNYSPMPIDYFIKNNLLVYQVSAGFHNSYFLTDKKEIYFCGTDEKKI